ncbi:hypothetical protein [Polymorphospora lycopeni]|uniref:Uncharacterized protein n=1 Tax=Polymorphospora lycopeni TaxID=3140240 RepID=A0ABV5CHQ8_9ACTN
MNIELATLLAVAAVWLTAGVVADGLPAVGTARGLRRRTALLVALAGTGLAAMAGVAAVALVTTDVAADQALRALALPAVPAVVVAVATTRRLLRLHRGAGAFASAPHTPAPPALRAAAAHPLLAMPLQVAGLLTLPATVTAAGLAELTGPTMLGLVLTAAVLAGASIGIRHSLRHSRLAAHAVTVLRAGRTARRVGPAPAVAAVSAGGRRPAGTAVR